MYLGKVVKAKKNKNKRTNPARLRIYKIKKKAYEDGHRKDGHRKRKLKETTLKAFFQALVSVHTHLVAQTVELTLDAKNV